MASADKNDPGEPPKTPKLLTRMDSNPLQPDTEENVAGQTESVFRNFSYQMLNNERDQTTIQETPGISEITQFTCEPLAISPPNDPFSPLQTSHIGRQLAQIGDDINQRYAPEFSRMIKSLDITPDTAYDVFAGVARNFFQRGDITWSRIITLLCFGYQMSLSVLRRGITGFFNKLVGFICKFIISERIAKWIADHGGWAAALRLVPSQVGWPTLGVIAGVAAMAVIAAVYFAKRR